MSMTVERLQQPLLFTVDVKNGLVQQPLRAQLMKGDKKANRIVVQLKNGSELVDLSGVSVSGSFIKPPDGDEIYLTGSVEDGMAVVELDDACYTDDGHFEASVALVMDGFKRTIVSFSGEVLSKGNGVVIDVYDVIPSIEEIIAQYAEMKRVTEKTERAAADAQKFADAAVRAETLAAGSPATARRETDENGNEIIIYGIPQGETGESAYEAAVRLGLTSLSEKEWLEEYETKRDAAIEAIEKKGEDTVNSIPADYTTLYNDVSSLKDHKADAIIDTSARAASHELHAQDGPLAVTLFGKTTETGTGDKSPDNPYMISGEGVVHFLFNGSENWMKSSLTVEGYSGFYLNDTRLVDTRVFVICDTFRMGTYQEWSGLVQDEFIEVITGSIGIRVKNERATDLTTWKAWLASNPVNAWCQVKRGEAVDSVAVGLSGESGRTAIGMPLLPDGSPLHGDGTVDDTVENDVLSGCDVKKIISSSDDLTLADFDTVKNVIYSDTKAGIVVTDGVIQTALPYPTTVYYRSTGYTPDKDLRVCRVVRKRESLTLDGTEDWRIDSGVYFTLWGCKPNKDQTTGSCTIAKYLYAYAGNCVFVISEGKLYCGRELTNLYGGDLNSWKEKLAALAAAGTPMVVTYTIATPEVYYTDPRTLRKPTGLVPVTVTGNGETEVTYPHDTKHYIDSQIAAAVALAMNG